MHIKETRYLALLDPEGQKGALPGHFSNVFVKTRDPMDPRDPRGLEMQPIPKIAVLDNGLSCLT